MKTESDSNELRAQADGAMQHGDFEEARSLYRRLEPAALSRADLTNLIMAEKHAMLLLLKKAWHATKDPHVGLVLADRLGSDDEAMEILGKILTDDLEPKDRWRIQCTRVNAALDRGPHRGLPAGTSWGEIGEDFLTAWNYLQSLGPAGSTLRQGMAQMLSRAHGSNGRDFLRALYSHPGFPTTLRVLVQKKLEELEAWSLVR
jgi:hypothetical protein